MESTISDFAHLQIPLEEILEATNNFADENIIGKGGFGSVYRGKLMRSGKLIKVSARKLDRNYGQGEVEFWTEISMLSSLEHKNIVSMIGFCDEKDEKIIVNRFYPKGSLSRHLSDPNLRWSERANIAAAVASAISYLHSMKPNYVIHRNINSSTILLDKNREPKLSGFEFSIKHLADRKNEVVRSKAIGTSGYIDPEIYKTGGVTHKSDIYSFGVVLLELLCGRRANEGNTLLAPLAKSHYENHTLPSIIHPGLRNQIHKKSFEDFTEVAFRCLDSKRSERWEASSLHLALSRISGSNKNADVRVIPVRSPFGGPPVTIMLTDMDFSFNEEGDSMDDYGEQSALNLRDNITGEEELKNLEGLRMPYGDLSEYAHWMSSRQEHVDLESAVRMVSRQEIVDVYDTDSLSTDENDDIVEHSASGLPTDQNDDIVEQSDSGLSIDQNNDIVEQSASGLPTDEKDDTGEHSGSASSVQENTELLKDLEELRVPLEWLWLPCYENVQTSMRGVEILRRCRHPNIVSILGFNNDYLTAFVFEKVDGTGTLYGNVKTKSWGDGGRKCSTWGKCLKIFVDVARGLNYLHNEMGDQKTAIHGDINTDNILVDKDGRAKIIGFRNSVLLPMDQDDDAIVAVRDDDERYYVDPEYAKTGKLKPASDVFSFGVVMFEIFYEDDVSSIVKKEGHKDEGIGQLVRRWFEEGIIKGKMASKFKKENSRNQKIITKGCNQESVDTVLDIVYKCLAEAQDQRPQIEVVLKELEKALSFQENHKDPLWMSFEDIKSATQDFSPSNYIGEGGFGKVFKGKLANKHGNGHYNIVAKLDKSHGQGEKQYYNELQILYEYKHENIIGLLGYSNETNEKFIVYELASKGSLDRYLNDASLTWRNRLKICIDVATGLDFIHGGAGGQSVVIHRDLKSANILLFDDWKAKVGDFGLSLISIINKETDFMIDHPCGTMCYVDPVYLHSKILTVESDIYSLGVLLFEILYGREAYKISKSESESLLDYIKRKFEEGKQEEIVFKAIRKEIMPKSLTTFLGIVQSCLAHDREKRPTSKQVLSQLKNALEFQNEEV